MAKKKAKKKTAKKKAAKKAEPKPKFQTPLGGFVYVVEELEAGGAIAVPCHKTNRGYYQITGPKAAFSTGFTRQNHPPAHAGNGAPVAVPANQGRHRIPPSPGAGHRAVL